MNTSPHFTYPDLDPASTGGRGRCPRCGEGKLFKGLDVRESCSACGLDFGFSDSGDGPTVFIILALGFVVLGAALYVELNYLPPIWVHIVAWPPLVFLLGLPLLRAVKGMLIAQQYKTNAAQGLLETESKQQNTQQKHSDAQQ